MYTQTQLSFPVSRNKFRILIAFSFILSHRGCIHVHVTTFTQHCLAVSTTEKLTHFSLMDCQRPSRGVCLCICMHDAWWSSNHWSPCRLGPYGWLQVSHGRWAGGMFEIYAVKTQAVLAVRYWPSIPKNCLIVESHVYLYPCKAFDTLTTAVCR